MFNENWPRWLSASVNKHFKQLECTGIPVFCEGEVRQTSDWDDFIEVRMDGPYWKEDTRDDFLLQIEVNILTQHTINADKNLYEALKTDGKVASLLATIPVYKLGNEEDDDGSQIGCLKWYRNPLPRDWARHSEFGQVNPKTNLRQRSVEAHYEIELKGV